MDKSRALVRIAMLSAASVILMMFVQIPILPTASYLRYDPSDAVALAAAFLLGPRVGVAVVALKDILYLLLRARSFFGPLGNFIAVGTFVGVAGYVYHRVGGSWLTRGLTACAMGVLARIVIMVPVNFVLLYFQFGMRPPRVAELIWSVIVPFNLFVGVVNAAITLIVVGVLFRTGTVQPTRV